MKQILVIIISFLIVSCGSDNKKEQDTADQSNTNTPKTIADSPRSADSNKDSMRINTTTDPIALIKQNVSRINTTKLEKKHTEFMCDEKMMVDRFYENGALVKISVDFATIGDVYAREDYYYDSGKLIFKYEFVEGGPACQGCIKKNEYRSYILDNKVIRYMKDQNIRSCRTCTFEGRSKELKLLAADTEEDIKNVLCR